MNFQCTFRHRRSIPRLRFPIIVQNFGDSATFSVDYCILYVECPPYYFYFRFVWPIDLESIPPASTPTSIIPTKFEVDMSILQSYSVLVCWYATWPWPLTFWPEQLQCMAGHMNNLATKLEYPMPIRSWFMRYNVFHWLPLKMRTRPLRMRRITWPVSRGSKRLHFWNPRPWFAYSLCTFGGSTINVIKVICENYVRPCVERRMSFCACAKSRGLLKVP